VIAQQIAVLAPVEPGREEALRAAIAALPTGGASPFARLPGTHFGRWVVLDRPGPDPRLVFSVVADATTTDYLRAALRVESFASLWADCLGWPDGDEVEKVRWLENHLVPATLPFGTNPARVEAITAGLTLSGRLRAFVVTTRTADPRSLRTAFGQDLG
jgi:hypothetical protein